MIYYPQNKSFNDKYLLFVTSKIMIEGLFALKGL